MEGRRQRETGREAVGEEEGKEGRNRERGKRGRERGGGGEWVLEARR